MSSTFTPTDAVDMSKEKDWASSLGMMDWDSTRIVFTKRTLIEFLRYTGTTVDTNFANISKLPKYATFGELGGSASEPPAATSAAAADPEPPSTRDSFRPTRRVRTAPGGETHDIFGHYVDDDALASAPPRTNKTADPVPGPEATAQKVEDEEQQGDPARNRASTGHSDRERVRMSTRDSVASLWDAPDAAPAFRPTRKVREMPGGRDSIADLL